MEHCPCTRVGNEYVANPKVTPRYEREQCPLNCYPSCMTAKYRCVSHDCGPYEDHKTLLK